LRSGILFPGSAGLYTQPGGHKEMYTTLVTACGKAAIRILYYHQKWDNLAQYIAVYPLAGAAPCRMSAPKIPLCKE
ncbi:hypothetical protein OSJ98_26015, partial [Escherichia coli]|nr:hypothetical protein [Escherichia coli]